MRPLRPSEAICVVGGEGRSASRRGDVLGVDVPRGFHATIAASREGKIRSQGRRGTRRRADATTSSRCRERNAEPRDDGSMRRHTRAHGGFARRAPRGGASPGRTLVPAERVTRVLPTCFTENMEGALMSYHSFLRKTSWAFFLPPFLPLDMRLFLPTAILLGWGGRAAVKGLAGRPDAREIISKGFRQTREPRPRRRQSNRALVFFSMANPVGKKRFARFVRLCVRIPVMSRIRNLPLH